MLKVKILEFGIVYYKIDNKSLFKMKGPQFIQLKYWEKIK